MAYAIFGNLYPGQQAVSEVPMPANFWMVVCNPENYRITQNLGFTIQGLKSQQTRKLQRVGPGDRILFYVSGIRRFAATAGRRGRATARLLNWDKRTANDVMADYFDDWRVSMPSISHAPTAWGLGPDMPGTGMAALNFASHHLMQQGRPRGGATGHGADVAEYELFDPGLPLEITLGAVRQLYVEQAALFLGILLRARHLEDHLCALEVCAVVSRLVPRSPHGKDLGLGNRDIPDGFSRRVELERVPLLVLGV